VNAWESEDFTGECTGRNFLGYGLGVNPHCREIRHASGGMAAGVIPESADRPRPGISLRDVEVPGSRQGAPRDDAYIGVD